MPASPKKNSFGADHAEKMTKARSNLVMAHPFFGSLALRLKMEPDPEMKEGASCDGKVLRYNPEVVEELPLSKVQGLIAHTVLHPAFLHHTRRGSRDPKKWNKACDFAINPILQEANIDLPHGTFLDTMYTGKTAEEIYTLLPDNEDDGGNENNNDPGGDGGVTDAPSESGNEPTQSEIDHEEADWKMTLAQAIHVAKQRGNLPASLERLVEEIFKPVLPWRDILRRFMTERANDDFSWAKGNRRFLAQGLYLPSRYSEGSGDIVIAIDTSGSIGPEELNEFANEIKGIVADAKPRKTIVIYCDAKIAHIDEFGPEDDLKFELHGGGGTDFRPPFDWVEEAQFIPKCFVYLTDGYGPFPEQEPPYPVMWCINNNDVVPPHGEHLVLEV